jgi:hypothetical protein
LHVFESLIVTIPRLHPSESFFDQLMGDISPVLKQEIGARPALPIPYHISHNDLPIGDIGGRRLFRLFAIGLFRFWAIDVPQINHFFPSIVVDRQPIAFMDGQDSCDELGSNKCRTGHGQGKHQAGRKAKLLHDRMLPSADHSANHFWILIQRRQNLTALLAVAIPVYTC